MISEKNNMRKCCVSSNKMSTLKKMRVEKTRDVYLLTIMKQYGKMRTGGELLLIFEGRGYKIVGL